MGNKSGLQLRFRSDPDGGRGAVVARARIPKRFAGAPTFLHGGIVATLLDEAMAKVNAQLGVTAVTHRLEVSYLRPVPPSRWIRIEGRNLSRRRLYYYNEARVLSAEGRVLARAKARFVALPRSLVSQLAAGS